MRRLRTPCAEIVVAAAARFDADNIVIENALKKLFGLFPSNSDPSEVLLKVVTLNRLYSTRILAVGTVAEHISRNAPYIDSEIANGSPEVVEFISKVTIGNRTWNFFSFASKYCSWHNPFAYPIYDTNVEACLWAYKKQDGFRDFPRSGLWTYRSFSSIVSEFRKFYGLESFSFKEIDKFLWQMREDSKSEIAV